MVNLMRLDLIKRVAISAAFKSAGILRSRFGKTPAMTRKKSATELVTEADEASEKAIIETIRSVFPEHEVLAEESGLNTGKTDCRWIVDPLDGTTNFAHQLGIFAVSIAFALNENVVVGVVMSPLTHELFSAVDGEGAELNGRPIRISEQRKVSESLLVTGFPYHLNVNAESLFNRFYHCTQASLGVRRLGSAALDLCYVACGRFDAFWEENLHAWDVAAGMLIAREAGAMVTDFAERPFRLGKKEILASNGHIHKEMLSLLANKDNDG